MTNTANTSTFTVALNKLIRDPKNVRKTYSQKGIEELAANLRADGFQPMHNLIVRKGKKGQYLVTDGERRRQALLVLAEAGEIAADFAVECKERNDDNATAASLAANQLREEMNPVDAFEAFKALEDEGQDVTAIATRFGTTETIVRQRLALAKVAPELLQEFRDGNMKESQLKAFTITTDKKRQVEVWNALNPYYREAHSIKHALTEELIGLDDDRFTFIGGVEVYEAAGGAIKRDLFDTDPTSGYATDVAILEKLVSAKFDSLAEQVKAEGWKWVECTREMPAGLHRMERFYAETVPLTEDEEDALINAQLEYEDLAELIDHGVADDQTESKLEAVKKRIEELENRPEVYSAEAFEKAGAFIMMDWHGRPKIERGFVKDDASDETGDNDNIQTPAEKQDKAPALPEMTHSAALMEKLTAHKTAALRIELANNADVALVAVVHAMLNNVAYGYGTHSVLEIHTSFSRLDRHLKEAGECKGQSAFNDLTDRYGDILPGNPDELFDWLLTQSQEMLLDLLAFAAAHSVNAVEMKFSQRRGDIAQADQLARALDVDMADWFETTGETYFNHVNRTTVELAVAEAKGSDAELAVRAAKKKGEAVIIAERQIAGTRWLPVPVRIAEAVADEEAEDEIAAGENPAAEAPAAA